MPLERPGARVIERGMLISLRLSQRLTALANCVPMRSPSRRGAPQQTALSI
jgi:hypothetical protein